MRDGTTTSSLIRERPRRNGCVPLATPIHTSSPAETRSSGWTDPSARKVAHETQKTDAHRFPRARTRPLSLPGKARLWDPQDRTRHLRHSGEPLVRSLLRDVSGGRWNPDEEWRSNRVLSRPQHAYVS